MPTRPRPALTAGCATCTWPAGAPLDGLADFAIAQSYLSTAAKWGIDALDALTQLFTDGPWLPAAIRPGRIATGTYPCHAVDADYRK